jgi:hypothetical protein
MNDHICTKIKTYVARRSVINTGLWVESGDDSATMGQPKILGVSANDYHEGAVLEVILSVRPTIEAALRVEVQP